MTARPTPAWVRDSVIYEINPRAFSASGDFRGITAGLDGLKKLGVNILWLMPIHPNGQVKKKGTLGSPYAVLDFYGINPAYGTTTDLKALVREAHARGFKIIIDIVANHTAWDSVMMKRPDFYKHDAQGHVISPVPDWQDVAGLDYSNPQLLEFMTKMLQWWLREFDFDGFRCDVAGMVPTSFWEEVRPQLEKAKPGVFLLAEWNSPDLLVKAFDVDYAWPFHSTLTDVLENGKPARALREVWLSERAKFPRHSLHMMFSDNHDEKRAIARFGEKGALAASALVFTMDGVPMLYNGMEVGDTTESGAPALFERLPIFWSIAERRAEFRPFYEKLIALRRQHEALRRGELVWLDNSDDSRVLTFLRRGAGEEMVVAINLSNRPVRARVTMDSAAGFDALDDSGTTLPAFELDAWGWRLYWRAVK